MKVPEDWIRVFSVRAWEGNLDAVYVLAASARTPMDCPTDLMNVPTDRAKASSVRLCETNLLEVTRRAAWVRTWSGWARALVAVKTPSVCEWIWRGCAIALEAVNPLAALVRSCTAWERTLEIVDCLDASTSIPRVCWTDLTKLPVDWVRVFIVSACAHILLAVHCLAVSVRIWMDSARLLVAVSRLEASADTPRSCWTALRNVPVDWARAWMFRDWDGFNLAVHCRAVPTSIWKA
jgi:hypothetical protein